MHFLPVLLLSLHGISLPDVFQAIHCSLRHVSVYDILLLFLHCSDSFFISDISRIDTDLIRSVFDCCNCQAIIKMYIRHQWNMDLLFNLADTFCRFHRCTATRMISHPAFSSLKICATHASTSSVFVFVIDWIAIFLHHRCIHPQFVLFWFYSCSYPFIFLLFPYPCRELATGNFSCILWYLHNLPLAASISYFGMYNKHPSIHCIEGPSSIFY